MIPLYIGKKKKVITQKKNEISTCNLPQNH